MDFKAKINELRQKKAEQAQAAKAAVEANDYTKLTEINNDMQKIADNIAALEAQAALSAENAASGDPAGKPGEAVKPFRTFDEQLKAIRDSAINRTVDERLTKVKNAANGSNEAVDAEGGFLVQEEFAGYIFESAATAGQILPRVDTYTVGSNANRASWVMADETDINDHVYGGVQMYWTKEAETVAASKPKYREKSMKLEKIMGITYVTEELMEDAPFVSSLTSRQFSLAAQRLLEGGVMSGTGVDQMLGILNSTALVEVGASGASVSAEDVLGMWQRFDTRYRSNAVWVAHPDLETQLPLLTLNGESVWLPEGGLSGQGYQTILGRPVIFTDHCAEAGKKGSFNLIDFNQYMLLKKGTVKEAWSMHVAFLTDQHAFRMTFRCNGAPKVDSPIKLKNSEITRSPFVTLGARS